MLTLHHATFQVAGLLQAWLKELPEPLVRMDLFVKVVETQSIRDEAQRLRSFRDVLKQVQFNCQFSVS